METPTPPPIPHCAVCNEPALLKCTGCQLLYYCNKQHRTKDWSKHRDLCRGYEVRTTAELGPHLVASRDIKKDDVILTENPFVVGPAHFDRVCPCCVGCCRKIEIRTSTTCPRCKWPVCSKMCPDLKAWHPVECSVFSSCTDEEENMSFWPSLLVLRCLLLQKSNPEKWEWILKMAPFADSKLVDSHKRNIQRSALTAMMNRVSNNSSAVGPAFIPDYSLATLEQVFAVLDVYSLHWRDFSRKIISALYPNASFLQHSCCSNTRPSFRYLLTHNAKDGRNGAETGQVIVEALKDIRKGEVLTCAWTFHLTTTAERQKELLFVKNMRCSCPRCLDPRELGTDLSTLKCTECSGWVLPVDVNDLEHSDWKCHACGNTLSVDIVEDRLGYLTKKMRTFSNQACETERIAESDQKMLEALLQTYLHPNHEFRFILKEHSMRYTGNGPSLERISLLSDTELETKAELCRSFFEVVDKLGPSLCQVENVVFLNLLTFAKVNAELTMRRFVSGALNKDQAASSVAACRRLLRRAVLLITLPNVVDQINFFPFIVILQKIRREDMANLTWAKENCLKLPDGNFLLYEARNGL